MNKTVTINISGIIFHIEEDAYDKLSKYLSTIKGYFSSADGGNEIMSDIEARIAEMLQEKTSNVKQVVLMKDVDYVISIMGQPEDFLDDETRQQKEKEEQSETTSNEEVKRRLFRDPDHKTIGGVCSGIAAYFDIDVIWIRIFTLLLIFFGGVPLLIYIILWMVIPEASTTAEKLAMRGKKINVDNISKKVQEEAEQLKQRLEKHGYDVKEKGANASRNFFDRLGDFLKEFFLFFIKFFARIVGLVLVVFGLIFMFGLMSSVFGFSIAGSSAEAKDWIDMFFISPDHYSLGILGIILFLGVPFLMMIYGGIKLLFKLYYSNRWLNLSAGIIWFAGLVIVLYVGIYTARDFSAAGRIKEQVSLETQKDTLYLTLNDAKDILLAKNLNQEGFDEYDRKYKHRKSNHRDYFLAKNENSNAIAGYATLNILPSNSDKFEMYIIKKSRGGEKRDAVRRAKNIKYNITQNDSVIVFDEIFTAGTNEKFRIQDVQIVLKVPQNKVVHLDKSLEHFIYDVENVTNTYDGDMVGRRWIMLEDGLTCIDCEGLDERNEVKIDEIKNIKINSEGVNVNVEDAKVKIDDDGINIEAKDAKVRIEDGGDISVKKKRKKKKK